MDTNKIRKRWQSQEEHTDTTLDYAISEIYKLCKVIEQLQPKLRKLQIVCFRNENEDLQCLREQIKIINANRQYTSSQNEDLKIDRVGRLNKIEQLQGENEQLKRRLGIREQCEKCQYRNPTGDATCPDNADGELPCAGFSEGNPDKLQALNDGKKKSQKK